MTDPRGGLVRPVVSAGRSSELTPMNPLRVTIEGVEIVIVRAEGRLFAFENLCPHQHLSAFHRGHLEGFVVTCPMHGWSFDVRSGSAVGGSGRLHVFDAREENGEIFIQRPGRSDAPGDPNW